MSPLLVSGTCVMPTLGTALGAQKEQCFRKGVFISIIARKYMQIYFTNAMNIILFQKQYVFFFQKPEP